MSTQPVTQLLEWLLVRFADWEHIYQVPVITSVDSPDRAALVKGRLTLALELIQQHAPEQFERIRLHMRGVVVGPLREAQARWRRHNQICMLDAQYVLAEDTTSIEIACTLIHELTHARLDAAGFRSTGEKRARIERLCFSAERNFMRRCPPSEDRDRAFALLDRQLSRDPDYWSDEAVRDRYLTRGSKWQQAIRFILRPLPDIH